nr:hypothetical protein [Mycobacterium eburneum]
MLERMLPGWTAKQLFSDYLPHNAARTGDTVPTDADEYVLAPIKPALDPAVLVGLWVTGYPIRGTQHHVDLMTVTATATGIKLRNYPPTPRCEGRATGHESNGTARLHGRHLMGHFRNRNDHYFYGCLHLSVLPGETLLRGYYTGFINDTEVVSEPWCWARIEPQSAASIDLAQVTLREPRAIYEKIVARTNFDGPMLIREVIEPL